MTTFIFMLTTDAGDAAIERVMTELYARFPEHEFMAGDADIGGYDDSILAIHGSAGDINDLGAVVLPNPSDVAEVNAAFRSILNDLKGWKPS